MESEREQELMDAAQQAQRRGAAHSELMNELSITEATVEESEDKHTTIKRILQKQLEEQHEKGTFANDGGGERSSARVLRERERETSSLNETRPSGCSCSSSVSGRSPELSSLLRNGAGGAQTRPRGRGGC